jgi:hypothetical protein
MKIAGKRTDKHWFAMKRRLQSQPTPRLWNSAFRSFYRTRIDTRYLDPIASIERTDTRTGEGFAIAALFCTLVEFLESCERGDNFRYRRRGDPPLQRHEYDQGQAAGYFKAFFRTRTPFDSSFPAALVDSFYQDVRCGLLHEARTKGGWVISSTKSGSALVSQNGGRIKLFREELIRSLNIYFVDYRRRLMIDPGTQQAFIRKFDHLCNP